MYLFNVIWLCSFESYAERRHYLNGRKCADSISVDNITDAVALFTPFIREIAVWSDYFRQLSPQDKRMLRESSTGIDLNTMELAFCDLR